MHLANTEHVEPLPRDFTVCLFASWSDAKCVLHADAKWLQTEFFPRYATELAKPGIQLVVPADTLFLTPPMLDKVNWTSQHSCGPAWQKAVTAALTPERMTLQTRYAALKQRFPQMLAVAGVKQAGTPQPALQVSAVRSFLRAGT